MSKIPSISTKRPIISHLELLIIKTAYDVGNPSPRLRQSQERGGVKPVDNIYVHNTYVVTRCVDNKYQL